MVAMAARATWRRCRRRGAERDLAPLQPQRYRLVDENAGSEQDWPTHNRVAVTVRLQRSAPRDLRRCLLTEARRFPGAEHEDVSPGAACLGAGAVGTQDGCRRCISIIR